MFDVILIFWYHCNHYDGHSPEWPELANRIPKTCRKTYFYSNKCISINVIHTGITTRWPLFSCDLPHMLITNLSRVHCSHRDSSTPLLLHPSTDSMSNETLSDVIVTGTARAFGLSAKLDEPFNCPNDWTAGTASLVLVMAAVGLLGVLVSSDCMGQ